MPLWLQITLAVMGGGLGLAAFVRFENARQTTVLLAELGRSLAVHIAECPARSRAVEQPDDSGACQLVDARGEPSQRWRK